MRQLNQRDGDMLIRYAPFVGAGTMVGKEGEVVGNFRGQYVSVEDEGREGGV